MCTCELQLETTITTMMNILIVNNMNILILAEYTNSKIRNIPSWGDPYICSRH